MLLFADRKRGCDWFIEVESKYRTKQDRHIATLFVRNETDCGVGKTRGGASKAKVAQPLLEVRYSQGSG